jgi:dTDP-4-dehydrorhamnose 3,5-epimerase
MDAKLKVHPTPIAGVVVIETTPFIDHRGSFARFFCQRELQPILRGRCIAQINHSRTAARGALRGLHYQRPPHADMKLVRCIKGAVWDVVVDLRAGSPTFLQWSAHELTPENTRMLVIPEGCAQGFQALEPDSEMLYLHTGFYAPEADSGFLHDDPRLAIAWPLPPVNLSLRDLDYPAIDPAFPGIVL